jgi:hypothetical protein
LGDLKWEEKLGMWRKQYVLGMRVLGVKRLGESFRSQ